LPDLKSWILQHMKQLHSPPATAQSDQNPFGVCITVGSTDSFSKCLTMFNGDAVLFDEYAYGSAVATARTHGRATVGVRMDAEGMVPEDLRRQIALARSSGLDPDMGACGAKLCCAEPCRAVMSVSCITDPV
jgi:DNA-binding transcriptional MocR family regulator